MRCRITLAVAVALCLVTTAYADYWVETFDNGPTGGFDQVWTAHDWAVRFGFGPRRSTRSAPRRAASTTVTTEYLVRTVPRWARA